MYVSIPILQSIAALLKGQRPISKVSPDFDFLLSMPFSTLDILLLCSAAIAVIIVWRKRKADDANPSGLPYPPGPPRKFLIGNIFDIPRLHAWHKFTEWKSQYGAYIMAPALSSSS